MIINEIKFENGGIKVYSRNNDFEPILFFTESQLKDFIKREIDEYLKKDSLVKLSEKYGVFK